MNVTKQIKIKKPSNLSAFFICLVIATALWLLHSLNTVYTKQFKVPVEFLNYPLNKVMAHDIPKELMVTVKASGLKLLLIGLNEPFSVVQLDFNDLKSNQSRNRFYLSSNTGAIEKLLKFKADIKGVYPDTISFINKAGTQKEVVVKVPLFIKYAQGYTGSDLKIEPNSIFINGDENDIKNVDTVYTSPIYLNDLKNNFNKSVNVLNSNSRIILGRNMVDVSVQVDKLIERELVLDIKVDNADGDYKYVLFPSKLKLKVTTSFNKVSEIDTALFKATVNMAQKKSNKLPVTISSLPDGIHIVGMEPKEVEFLRIKRK